MIQSPGGEPRRIDPAGAFFALGVPLLSVAITLALTALWQDRLPTQIAHRWGSGDFTSLWSHAWAIAALMLICGAVGAVGALARVPLMLRRVLLITSITATTMLSTVNGVLMESQLGLENAEGVPRPVWSIGLGVAIGLAVGLVGSSMLQDLRPRVAATTKPDADLPRAANPTLPIEFTLGLRPLWLWIVCGLSAVGAVAACVAAGDVWPLPLFAPVPLLVFGTARYRVEADEHGLRVRTMGSAMINYNISEVEGARVITVHPFLDFGGWGMRFKGKGRCGVVTESGPAAQIAMAGGDVLTITTARAEELAGALNTLADRR